MNEQENITPIDQYVIDFIRQLRDKKNLTQEDIAAAIGVKRTFIGSVESINSRAKYKLAHINALADYLGCSPRDFLPEKAIPVNPPEKEKRKATAPIKKKVVKKGK